MAAVPLTLPSLLKRAVFMKYLDRTEVTVDQESVAIDAITETHTTTAYIVSAQYASQLPVRMLGARFQGQETGWVRVPADDAEFERFVAGAAEGIDVVDLPTSAAARAKFVAQWIKKAAEKNKNLTLPLLVLPLAACGGGGGGSAPVDPPVEPPVNTFDVAETPASSGSWLIDSDNGDVVIAGGGADYSLTPTEGDAVAVPQASVSEFVVNSTTVRVDAAVISGEVITGSGAVIVTNIESDLDVDLGNIATSTLQATVDSTGGVTFVSSAKFGSAVITVNGVVGEDTDKVAFQEGADLSSASFVVTAGALLELTVGQINTVSQTGPVTGAGDLRLVVPDDEGDNAIEALVVVDLEGGNLTFDLLDDADTLVLAAGSSIDLGGGNLIIDDGTIDILTNAADFTNVGSVVVNSGLTLSVTQLQQLSGDVVTQGGGRLDVKVTSAEDVAALAQIIESVVKAGEVPQISVGVDPSVSEAAKTAIDSGMDVDFATALSSATGVNVPVTNSSGKALKVGPTLSLTDDTDNGTQNTGAIDGVSNVSDPVIEVDLPVDETTGEVLVEAGDVFKILVGGTLVHEETLAAGGVGFSTTITLSDALVSLGASGIVEGANTITAQIVRDTTTINSNELRYTLDLTAPNDPTVAGVTTTADGVEITDGLINNADVMGTFVRVTLSDDVAKGDIVELHLNGATLATMRVGVSQLSDGHVDFQLPKGHWGVDGDKTLTAQVTDAAGNQGAVSAALSMTLDTAVLAPVILAVAGNNVVNVGEEASIISGSNEAGATVAITFGSPAVTHSATVEGSSWTYQLTEADITAMGQGSATLSVVQTDAAGNVSAAATHSIEIDTVAPLSFVADTSSEGSVTFTGTASGDVTVSAEADGSATFARGGIAAEGSVANLATVDIVMPDAESALKVVLNGSGAANAFEINAQNATTMHFSGDLGASADTVVVRVIDTDATSKQTKELTLDTSGITSVGDTLRFLFDVSADQHNDTVALSADSKITSAVSSIVVTHGTLDLTKADIAPGISIPSLASGVIVTVEQFLTMGSIVSITGSGELTIQAADGAALADLQAFLAAPGSMTLIGLHIFIEDADGVSTQIDDLSDAVLKAGLQALSFPGIPQLTEMLESVQGQMTTLTDGVSADFDTLVEVAAKLVSLQTGMDSLNGVGEGSVAKSIS
ncbi:MAG TPA: hypothetical protein DD440_07675, partial [Porticoccaceae bacterium]|nr:hypothetical protein [Porticoccaceae bacterium]